MIAIALLLGLMMVPDQSAASSEAQGQRTKVAFTVTLPEPYKEATVSARLDERSQTLASLEVHMRGKPIQIPRKAFTDLPKPNLRTLELRYSELETSHPEWYVVLSFQYGDPITPTPFDEDAENRDRFSSVAIQISQGRAVGRRIFRAEDGGSSKFEKF